MSSTRSKPDGLGSSIHTPARAKHRSSRAIGSSDVLRASATSASWPTKHAAMCCGKSDTSGESWLGSSSRAHTGNEQHPAPAVDLLMKAGVGLLDAEQIRHVMDRQTDSNQVDALEALEGLVDVVHSLISDNYFAGSTPISPTGWFNRVRRQLVLPAGSECE